MVARHIKYCLFISIMLFIKEVKAQEVILTGRAVNIDNSPFEFITATLLQKDGTSAAETIADSLGFFSITANKGKYLLKFSYLKRDLFEKELELDDNSNLGEIKIDESIMLDEITIAAQRKLIEKKVDGYVFNVQNSIASQGMDGLEALAKAPMIRVQNNNISLVGKSNISVMINGKMLYLSGNDLTNYIQSLRSDDISRIEVITTPSSKYESQGNSGIVNIILKKNPSLGWNGSISSAVQQNSTSGMRLGGTLNFASEKISSTLIIRHGNVGYKPKGDRYLETSTSNVLVNEIRDDRTKATGVNLNFDYYINERSNIGFVYDFGHTSYEMDAINNSQYSSRSGTLDSILMTNSLQDWKTPNHTLNLFYETKLDTSGSKLTVSTNYLNSAPFKQNNFDTENDKTHNLDQIKNNSNMNYEIYSGQADLYRQFSWGNIETGLKYTLLKNSSSISFFNKTDDIYIRDIAKSNKFKYDEDNFAVYISSQYNITDKWEAKVGLRYEYTNLTGTSSENIIDHVKNKYGKLFPTGYIAYKPNDSHNFSLSYSRRINRPGFQSLNPFRWYTNPYIYYSGNPTLQPSYNNNVELSYSYKNKVIVNLYNQYMTDGTSNIAVFKDGLYSNTTRNAFDQNTFGVMIGYYDTFFKMWETSMDVTASRVNLKPIIEEIPKIDGNALSYSMNNTIAINNRKTHFIMLNWTHYLPYYYGATKLQDQMNFSAGYKSNFFNNRLQISFIANDLFKTLRNDGYTLYSGYSERFRQYNDHRRVTLSLTYSIGNKKVKTVNRNIKFDDKRRVN